MNFNESNNLPYHPYTIAFITSKKQRRSKATNYRGTQRGTKLISIKRPLFARFLLTDWFRVSSPPPSRCKLLSNPPPSLRSFRATRLSKSLEFVHSSIRERAIAGTLMKVGVRV